MEEFKKEIEASKIVENKWEIDQFLSRASMDMDHNCELFKEITNGACMTFSVEDEEYKQVEKVIKKYRELEKFYKEINSYTYYLTHSIYGNVRQEWMDKNCEFGEECFYLDHLVSEREEKYNIENGLINIDRTDGKGRLPPRNPDSPRYEDQYISSSGDEDEDNNQLSAYELENKFFDAYNYFAHETQAGIRSFLEKKKEEIYKKIQNLLSKKNEKERKKVDITVLEQQVLEQQLKAVVEEENEKIKEGIMNEIEKLEY